MATSLIVVACSAVIVFTLYRFLRSLPRQIRAYIAIGAVIAVEFGFAVGVGVNTGDPTLAIGAFFFAFLFGSVAIHGIILSGVDG